MSVRFFLFCILLISQIVAQSSIGSSCTHTLQCGSGSFCYENVCRKDGCTISSQCREGEKCEYGQVNGRYKPACFPAKVKSIKVEDYCPGGGSVVTGFDGHFATCDMTKGCVGNQVCNPQNGYCCTKLRTCPKPTKTMLSLITGQPIMCQFKFGTQTPCPSSGYCELKTGFCCHRSDGGNLLPIPSRPSPIAPSSKEKPSVGEVCTAATGCSGGAYCNCENFGACKCECPTKLGYSVSSDGKTCQRLRRRLKEKCKSDMECSAAFSECATGGCRCKKGFQRDGDGGCKPISYKCPGSGSPVMNSDKPVICYRRAAFSQQNVNITKERVKVSVSMNDQSRSRREQDSCPPDHYCVAVFDAVTRPGFYQGFCCPTPSDLRPVCPVGEAHESSYYPNFGCTDCPNDYYCHRDGVVTEQSICCPKPCISMDDVYHNGQCHSIAFYGDTCIINAQCTSKPSDKHDDFEQAALECRKGVCQCPGGYSHTNGQCKRVTCTVGLKGEPSVDRNNELLTCTKSSDCSQGQLCDINHNVCCKGINRCPSGYEETGEPCASGQCSNTSHICYLANEFKKTRICCVSS